MEKTHGRIETNDAEPPRRDDGTTSERSAAAAAAAAAAAGHDDDDSPSPTTTPPTPATIDPLRLVPTFHRSDLTLGAVLGAGSFCRVSAVNDIVTPPDDEDDEGDDHEGDDELYEREGHAVRKRRKAALVSLYEEYRAFANSDRNDKPPPRFAIKYLKSNLKPRDTERGTLDVEAELRMLVKASGHANIVALHAHGSMYYPLKKTTSKFLLLDRLRSTLGQRMHAWRERRGLGIFEKLSIGERSSRDLWLERMLLLSRVASALSFLHKKGIIYRDLKPENVGFDYDNTPKIFDFGLARTLDRSCRVPSPTGVVVDENNDRPQDDNDDDDDDHVRFLYKLTGMTGSPRYMSPEISECRPYNTSADVYSFAVVTHEVLSLRTPFVHIKYDIKVLQEEVNVKGTRPPIDGAWPRGVTDLLERMWDGDLRRRPTMSEVEERIENLLRGGEDQLFPTWGIIKWNQILG